MDAPFAGTSRFEILRVLGRGGVGVVYEAVDREQGRHVALKTLRAPSPDALLRFKREFRTLQDLEHPNLVALGELIEDGGTWFFTMELVPGSDLLSHVRAPGGTPTSSGITPALSPTPDADSFESPEEATARQRPAVPVRTASTSDLTGVTSTDGVHGEDPPAEDAPASPGPRRFDEDRLRHAFAQLAEGLDALHRAGLVHRDVKPSNVLVTPEGRVVLLDFGIIAEVADGVEERVPGMGTAPFMSPEQWRGEAPRPASDWYAFGVALYEALTGALPFTGKNRQEVARKKVGSSPRPPRELCADVPADLEYLCLSLLGREPEMRPGGAEIMRRLRQSSGRSVPVRRAASQFVGREAELARLAAAWDDTRRGAVTVLVTGESGIGKSALVRRFREDVLAHTPEVLVLAGRCHERESVPYKAIDGAVDGLARRLRQLPDEDAERLLPATGVLGQVFPVLRQLDPPGPAPAGGEVDRQRQLFTALRELFVRVGERWPLLLLVDDLQWADNDSLLLLAELLRPPGPRLLFLGTQRGAPVRLGELVPRQLVLAGLPGAEAQQLARRWLGGTARPELVDTLAREAAGHPLLIAELSQHMSREGHTPRPEGLASQPLRLDDALFRRMTRLAAPARRVLEVVVIAGLPLAQSLLAEVVGVPFAELTPLVAQLRAARLLRTTGERPSSRVEPYHDRIREALRARLPAESARAWHARLAHVLAGAPGTAPELLSSHWEGAGEPRLAALAAVRAAEEAREALAFARAARLYARARTLLASSAGEAEAGELLRLEVAHADALVLAGRSGEAATVYVEAARHAPASRALDLRRRAGEAYLVSGQVDAGMATMSELLAEVGMPLPRSRWSTLVQIGTTRAHLALRGLETRLVEEADVAPELLLEMDIAWAAGMGLAFVDVIQSTWFQQRFLLLTLRTGERRRVLRGLVCEAMMLAAGGSKAAPRTAAMLARLAALAETVDGPYERGWVACCGALCAHLEGRPGRVLSLAAGALAELERAGFSSSWEVDTLRVMLVTNQFQTGRLRDMVASSEAFLRASRDRGDLYEGTLLRTAIANHVWLVRGEPELARRMASEAVAGWSRRGTIVHAFMDVVAQSSIDLYEDPQGAAAWRRVTAGWRDIQKAYMLDYQVGRVQSLDQRGRATVAAARGARGHEARELRRAGERDGEALRREGSPPSGPLGGLLVAAVRFQEGRVEEAVSLLGAAAGGFDSAGMALHAHAARRRLGVLLGGDEGRALVTAADAWLASEAVAEPTRLVAMLVPGFSP